MLAEFQFPPRSPTGFRQHVRPDLTDKVSITPLAATHSRDRSTEYAASSLGAAAELLYAPITVSGLYCPTCIQHPQTARLISFGSTALLRR